MKTNISKNTPDAEGTEGTTRHQQRGHTIHKFQTYLFEFGTDEKLYSVSFIGKIPPKDIKEMLESARNCLYADMAESILNHLKQYHLAYKNFFAKEMPLDYKTAARHTNILLHSTAHSIIDEKIGEADMYYGIMDYQRWKKDNSCEGCYFAVKREVSEQKSLYQHKIIGQTFYYNEINNEEKSYFAIRTNNKNGDIDTIDSARNRAIIPTFGCIDMVELLLNIDNIKTARQAKRIAMK